MLWELLDDLLLQHEIDSSPKLSAMAALWEIEIDALLEGDIETSQLASLLGDLTPAEVAEAEADNVLWSADGYYIG